MIRKIDLGLVDGQLILTEDDIADIAKNANNDIVSEVKAELDAINGYQGYSDIVGLQVDYENGIFSRLAAAKGLEAGDDFDKFPMYGGMKRCCVDKNGNSLNVTDENNQDYCMVYIPKFYYRVMPLKLEKQTGTYKHGYHVCKANYYISSKQYPNFKLHPAFVNEKGKEIDHFLYSAYEGSVLGHDDSIDEAKPSSYGCLVSAINKKPVSGKWWYFYQEDAEKWCTNNGKGWHCETIKSLAALQLLMIIEFGSMNIQDAFNQGITNGDTFSVSGSIQNSSALTGSTKNLGSKTGVATTTIFKAKSSTEEPIVATYTENGKVAISYRGIENPYGNLSRCIQGIYLDGLRSEDFTTQPWVCTDFNYVYEKAATDKKNYECADWTVGVYLSGYISAMGYGSEKYDWLFIPSEANGTSALPVGDKCKCTYRMLAFGNAISHGGSWDSGDTAGMFFIDNAGYGQYSLNDGCRLIYIPQN